MPPRGWLVGMVERPQAYKSVCAQFLHHSVQVTKLSEFPSAQWQYCPPLSAS